MMKNGLSSFMRMMNESGNTSGWVVAVRRKLASQHDYYERAARYYEQHTVTLAVNREFHHRQHPPVGDGCGSLLGWGGEKPQDDWVSIQSSLKLSRSRAKVKKGR